jgi:copper transport protein
VSSRGRRRIAVAAAALLAGLGLPATAWAHAALLRTSPSASVTVNSPPAQVSLTYSEAVEPRFAIVSVTDAGGRQQTAGPPHRSAQNPDELDVPLNRLAEGWYLVFWRVISADGHPVRGAFTFAVGPNPGPAPRFVIPSISETAATPGLLTARWLVFLTTMAAIGLFVFRAVIARPLRQRVPGSSLRAVTIAFAVALLAALLITPLYLLVATAKFALRSTWDVGAVVPLLRVSAFGRGFLDLELVLALFAVAAAVLIRVERARSRQRPVAELLALTGALLAAAAALLVPGVAGHAAQTSPRGVSVALDWLHLVTGSVWLGGADRADRALGEPRCAATPRRSRRLRPALLPRRFLVCPASDRNGRRRRDHPPAHAVVPLADVLRQDDHRQGRTARCGDALRRRQPHA